MRTHTQETQASITPEHALQYLREGNLRFVENLRAHRNLLEQVNETRDGQFPFATVLSCIDSRVSAELVFDQGLGDIFSIRVAGNVINDDVLGSMEFATKVAGAKAVVVLGHSKCGAIKVASGKWKPVASPRYWSIRRDRIRIQRIGGLSIETLLVWQRTVMWRMFQTWLAAPTEVVQKVWWVFFSRFYAWREGRH